MGVTEALATPVCNPVWRDGADCLSCRWDEVIPSGICVRKNPVSEGWQNWKESKETGQTFRKSGVVRLSGGYPLKAGQLEYDCRYSTMHGMPVTGGRGFRGLKPLWHNGVPP